MFGVLKLHACRMEGWLSITLGVLYFGTWSETPMLSILWFTYNISHVHGICDLRRDLGVIDAIDDTKT